MFVNQSKRAVKLDVSRLKCWSCWADSNCQMSAAIRPTSCRDPLRFAPLNVPSARVGSSNADGMQKTASPLGTRIFWSCWADSNCRPHPYQGCALPTELQQHTCPRLGASKMATEKGLEPSTSSVTGWRSNQLNYSATSAFIRYQIIAPMSISFLKIFFSCCQKILCYNNRKQYHPRPAQPREREKRRRK